MPPVRDDPSVIELVERARDGEQDAWDQLVARYAPLVWAMCRRYGLSRADAEDVGACVWLRLVERLETIREPAALPGWLATTARHECLYLLRTKKRQVPVDTEDYFDDEAEPASDEWLLAQERQIALRAAFATLSQRCQRLLSLLFADPPMPYAQISAELQISVGSIGPQRGRCLEELRAAPQLAALLESRPARMDR